MTRLANYLARYAIAFDYWRQHTQFTVYSRTITDIGDHGAMSGIAIELGQGRGKSR